MVPKKDVVVKDSKENLPAVAPDLGRGHEVPMDQDELQIPRAMLVQSTSEAATSNENRVAIGKIINNLTKLELSSVFIPIMKLPNSYIQWNPRKKDDPNFDPAYDPGAMVFISADPNDPRVIEGKVFGPNGEAPKVTRYINYLAYFPGEFMPVVLSFAKTSFNAGKKLNSMTRFAGGDIFSNQFTLRSVQREQAGTKFFAFDVAPAGKASEENYKIAERFYNEFRTKKVDVNPASDDHAEVGGDKTQQQFEE